jgi:hypothetical protein
VAISLNDFADSVQYYNGYVKEKRRRSRGHAIT